MGTRRLFVLLPQRGAPVAVAHRIELQPLQGFPGEVRPYGSWRELHAHPRALVAGQRLAVGGSPPRALAHPPRVPPRGLQLLRAFRGTLLPSAPPLTPLP